MNVRFCGLLLLLPIASTLAEEKGKKEATPPRAIARITGPLICTHCELGIGDECRAGIQIGKVVFVLDGKANDELLDDRLSGVVRQVVGVLTVQDGFLHLRGVNDKTLPENAKPEMMVTGLVARKGESWALLNAKEPIFVAGNTAPLENQVGKWIEARGTLDLDRQGHVRLTATEAKPATEPSR